MCHSPVQQSTLAATQLQDQKQSSLRLDVIILEGTIFFKLYPSQHQSLLIGRYAFLLLDHSFQIAWHTFCTSSGIGPVGSDRILDHGKSAHRSNSYTACNRSAETRASHARSLELLWGPPKKIQNSPKNSYKMQTISPE